MRTEILFEEKDWGLIRYDHACDGPHEDPDREESEFYSVNYVERGSFNLHRGGETWRLSRGAVFVTRPGFRYRCTHETPKPDDVCLSLRLPPDLVRDMSSSARRRWDAIVPVRPLTNRLAYLHRRLAAPGGTLVTDLVPEVVGALLGVEPPPRLHGPGLLAWHAERIDAARELMERRFAEPLTIEALGREVGISPFHFSRLFRDLVGMPPHRYLVRVRLARAAEALGRGASVTAAGLDSGFPNLGHFIRQFRRAHGVTPSRYRRRLAAK